jgi:hypothetical protein
VIDPITPRFEKRAEVIPPTSTVNLRMGTRLRFVRFPAVMRCVKIIKRPNETYPFAALDQATGEIPPQLADRADLVALCGRLGWTIQDDSQRAGITRAADLPQPISERYWARRPAKPVRHRLGGATKYTSARKRRSSRAAASSGGRR